MRSSLTTAALVLGLSPLLSCRTPVNGSGSTTKDDGEGLAHSSLHQQTFPNAAGQASNLSTFAAGDTTNPFFKAFGPNGRSCLTCHMPGDGWTITPEHLKQRFEETQGMDPVFRPHDGANSPTADVSTVEARRRAYSMLLERGVIRLGLPMPAGAEFKITKVDDPWGFASAEHLSTFRRPLPTTNFKFLSAAGWDGGATIGRTLPEAFALIANLASISHGQSAPLSPEIQAQLVQFMSSQFSAQAMDQAAGDLTADGAQGGPAGLPSQDFFIGINDPIGMNPKGTPFDPAAMHLFDAWKNLSQTDAQASARAAIARGQTLFNSKPINIAGVKGLNDKVGKAVVQGTCTTCHDSPNAGTHSVAMALDIGISDASRRFAGLPLYTLQNIATGETMTTTDIGRGLSTGKWADIGKFKGPFLRGVVSRPPYFHNGFAATLGDVVAFYNDRFQIGFTEQEKQDLVAFLKAL